MRFKLLVDMLLSDMINIVIRYFLDAYVELADPTTVFYHVGLGNIVCNMVRLETERARVRSPRRLGFFLDKLVSFQKKLILLSKSPLLYLR